MMHTKRSYLWIICQSEVAGRRNTWGVDGTVQYILDLPPGNHTLWIRYSTTNSPEAPIATKRQMAEPIWMGKDNAWAIRQ